MTETHAERTIQRILNAIPGYSGYREKESRRDADRAVRDRLVAELSQRAERVERVAQRLADERRIRDVGAVNAYAEAIRQLANRINTATYGYGGLFGNRDVDAAVLDQIRLFDESLFAGLEEIDGGISDLEAAAGDVIAAAADAGQRSVDALTARFELRERVVESARPASPEEMSGVLAVLQTPEERAAAQAPPAAYDLHDRDALAVLGDNFVVDARIDIESAAGNFRLFRVDVAPERWLYVSRQRGADHAMLERSHATYAVAPSPTIGNEAFAIDASGTGSGEVIGAGGQTGRRPVAYTLLRGTSETNRRAVVLQWGAEQQIFVGNQVHPDDVEVFGKPS